MLSVEFKYLLKVYITQPVLSEAIDWLNSRFQVVRNTEDRVLAKAQLIENLKGVDGVVTLLTDVIDQEVLEASPALKIVSNVAVGFNNIDVQAATRLGVLVSNTPGVLTETSADLALALMMAAARRISESERFTRAHKFKTWGLQMFLGHDVYGKTLGIIGLGRIGRAMARRAQGFGMRVLFYNSRPVAPDVAAEYGATPVSLEELYRQADYISLHVPLSAETKHLLSDTAFAQMKIGRAHV